MLYFAMPSEVSCRLAPVWDPAQPPYQIHWWERNRSGGANHEHLLPVAVSAIGPRPTRGRSHAGGDLCKTSTVNGGGALVEELGNSGSDLGNPHFGLVVVRCLESLSALRRYLIEAFSHRSRPGNMPPGQMSGSLLPLNHGLNVSDGGCKGGFLAKTVFGLDAVPRHDHQ